MQIFIASVAEIHSKLFVTYWNYGVVWPRYSREYTQYDCGTRRKEKAMQI